MNAHLRIETQPGSGIRLIGEVDFSNAAGVKDAVASDPETTGDFVIDGSGLEFIDSSGFRVLIQIAAQLAKEERRLILLSPSRFIEKAIHILRLTSIPNLEIIEAPC